MLLLLVLPLLVIHLLCLTAAPLHGPQRLSGTGRLIFMDTLEAPLYDAEDVTEPTVYETTTESTLTLSAQRVRPTKAFAPRTWQASTTQQSMRDGFTDTLVKFAETAVTEILNRTKRFLRAFA
ncbi:unnamed protein product [Bursaphelenchus okinawaensis]|uniref:Secreted protein n=1 Tax=Bursaphelenchus okinawaensis TaxID=465554 RepID=A0A811LDX0_9BILA|nr:unnamed protein product [Bursaphelenchus okinawaensis]CAG9122069.1 unnamed protein product [Bursaphelenchus okinawaensis]